MLVKWHISDAARAMKPGCVLLLIWLVVLARPVLGVEKLCPADYVDESVQVAKVHDGDTLKLADGRNVRLIGINTPELARKGKPAEPLAYKAKEFVQRRVLRTGFVRLRYGSQRKDHYGRTLAYVYLEDGNSLSALLAQRGLGHAVVIAPNDWNVACFFKAEQTARHKRRGIWRYSRYQPQPVKKLTRKHQGFQLIKGTVSRVGESRKAWWLNFKKQGKPKVAIRIPRRYAKNFAVDIKALKGRMIEARGWMRLIKGELRMNVSHEAMLKVE